MIEQLTRAIARSLEVRNYAGQGPNFPVSTVDSFLDFVSGGGGGTWTGASVTPATATRLTAVWACISCIADSIAQLPTFPLRLLEDGGKERARDHYLYRVLHKQVNPQMTPFRFKQLMQTWILQHGNAYALVEVNGRGQVIAMYPWHPSRVSVRFENGEPFYKYRFDNGETLERNWSYVIHLRGLGTDGFFGLSPIQEHRQTLGFALAVQEHGARFFSNGARPLGVLEHPGPNPIKSGVDKIREAWQATYGGLSNAHKIAILEEGMKYHDIGLSMVDSQYVEASQFTVEDIARIYRVPPHKIGHLLRSTNNNIEHQGLEWLTDTINPWCVNWEQELTRILLSDREAETIQISFLRNATMWMDSTGRSKYFATGRQWGYLTENDCRRLEDMNPFKNGDRRLQPVNMIAIDENGEVDAGQARMLGELIARLPQQTPEIREEGGDNEGV